jgi:hypothetical protein
LTFVRIASKAAIASFHARFGAAALPIDSVARAGYSRSMRAPLLFPSLAAATALFAFGCGGDDSASPGKGGGSGSDGSTTSDGSSSQADGGSSSEGSVDDGQSPGSEGGGSITPTVGGLFEQPEPWTEDVSAAAKDARSDAIIAALGSLGGWGNGNKLQIDFSIPLFFADSSTPRQTITAAGKYCYGGPDCDPVPLQMPLPANGNTEGSSDYTCDTSGHTSGQGDCHVLVVEKDQKKLYELYNSTKSGSAFTALGAFVWDLTKAYPNNLRGDQCTSADAAGFPIGALLPTADEVAAGEVKHAIRFILPNERMKKGVYVHPATHAGSPSSTDANAPPYGVRFRLKASFDETPFNAGEKVILHALKKYGMLLSDGGDVALTFADDRTSTAKWAGQGVTAQSFTAIKVTDFDVVDLSAEIALTDDCVRKPLIGATEARTRPRGARPPDRGVRGRWAGSGGRRRAGRRSRSWPRVPNTRR